MNEIVIKGTQNFMGIGIPIVYGGFGEGQKVVADKTVALIHNQPEREIRRRVVDNIKKFKEGIDFIDLKPRVGESHTLDFLTKMGYAKQSIVQTNHIYLLSERGYMKLIKVMNDDKSWDVMENFIDEYFRMKEHIITSPTLSEDAYTEILRRMEERDQRHYDTMMSMFKSFETSMRNLANVLIIQTNNPIGVKELEETTGSNYTKEGRAYREEVLSLCRQIVALSNFSDEKSVLSACYKHLNKNYGIVWDQEIHDWKESHAWAGKVSPLNVISESDDGKYLKSMLKNILMQILDDCKKKGVAAASYSELDSEEVETTVPDNVTAGKPNEMRISTYVPAEDFDSACKLIAQIAKQSGDKSPHNAVTFMRVYNSMDDYASICWDYHERKFRQNHKFPKSARVSKKCMINESSKLQKLFVAAVNKYMEEIENAK